MSAVIDEFAASVNRAARSGGSGAPAFGGRDDWRSARTVRPSFSKLLSSLSHLPCSASTRAVSPSLSWVASARLSSSRAPLSAATTTLRMSRRSTSAMPASAASALSRHSALRSRGKRFSPTASSIFGGISGWPALLAATFCFSTRTRRPGTPSRSTTRANGRWISGRLFRTASR